MVFNAFAAELAAFNAANVFVFTAFVANVPTFFAAFAAAFAATFAALRAFNKKELIGAAIGAKDAPAAFPRFPALLDVAAFSIVSKVYADTKFDRCGVKHHPSHLHIQFT